MQDADVVGRGEVLERMTTVPRPEGDGFLEALWQGGARGGRRGRPVLLCPPHPRLGGSMDSAVLAELVWALGRRRHPTLRFNYRGVGASQGSIALPPLPSPSPVDLDPLVDDARAALAQLLQTTGERTAAVVGVSVGALVAARLAADDDGVDRAFLVSPPVGLQDEAVVSAIVQRLVQGAVPVTVVVGGADRAVDVDVVARRFSSATMPVVLDSADHLFQRGLTALSRLAEDALGHTDDDDADDGRDDLLM